MKLDVVFKVKLHNFWKNYSLFHIFAYIILLRNTGFTSLIRFGCPIDMIILMSIKTIF